MKELNKNTQTTDLSTKQPLGIDGVIPRTVIFYINYFKGVGIVEKKRMLENHPDIENEKYIFDNILPNNDEVCPYYEYVV